MHICLSSTVCRPDRGLLCPRFYNSILLYLENMYEGARGHSARREKGGPAKGKADAKKAAEVQAEPTPLQKSGKLKRLDSEKTNVVKVRDTPYKIHRIVQPPYSGRLGRAGLPHPNQQMPAESTHDST